MKTTERKPNFSIITATLNAERNLERCIHSVFSQKNINVEHILVDGESSDETAAIIIKWAAKNKQLKYIIEKDQGIYDAWNKGVKIATGSWVLFLGADDFLLQDDVLMQIQNDIMIKHEKPAFLSSLLIKGDSERIERGGRLKAERFVENMYDGPIITMPPQPALFHSKAIFDEGYKFDAKYKTAADKKLFLQLFGVADIQYIDVITTYFSLGGVTNRSGNLLARWLEKNRLRKELRMPIVPYFFFRSLIGAFLRDLLYYAQRFK